MEIIRNCDRCEREDTIDCITGLCPSCLKENEEQEDKCSQCHENFEDCVCEDDEEGLKGVINKMANDFKELKEQISWANPIQLRSIKLSEFDLSFNERHILENRIIRKLRRTK